METWSISTISSADDDDDDDDDNDDDLLPKWSVRTLWFAGVNLRIMWSLHFSIFKMTWPVDHGDDNDDDDDYDNNGGNGDDGHGWVDPQT